MPSKVILPTLSIVPSGIILSVWCMISGPLSLYRNVRRGPCVWPVTLPAASLSVPVYSPGFVVYSASRHAPSRRHGPHHRY